MAKMKPVVIDCNVTEIVDKPGSTLRDIVPTDVKSVTTLDGQLVPRSAFGATPVPAGFETNWTTVNKGASA